MCRLAAYLGPAVELQHFLLQPEHSLLKQSWAPREMQEAVLNADGFGLGWYDPAGQPAIYRNVLPIWADSNLPSLGRSLREPLWLAAVRSATEGFATGLANTQPFYDRELLFLHNGFLERFATEGRARIRRWLQPDIEAAIHGNTDSEYLFAVLRQLLREEPDASLEQVLMQLVQRLAHWCEDSTALLSLVLSDGRRIYALRHAINRDCASLYYSTDEESFPGGQLVASEPLTAPEFWRSVPPHHLLVLDPDEPPSLAAL
ncbi:ergothioneine biosynthesis protein EgtC [Alkalilimnicola sp. S0819]|uniref:ergothioneine biosynthesis protein EgtC n=1 Tax=Alkalilimnicola sp. S0819 TaxID=2613922 RepID=UPI0012628501|nr:ergothioneine biosynthesis protein EgtC [Alkalilimnicola sp. S0819]KAB7623170.1 ergothioneine biosynthesis protein EgtC [Alkalilimnicola sp. S0819]MPQ17014.1 ergothioneine biosynthesis protein EgtC [Alkalilimnicola sp. S0819]